MAAGALKRRLGLGLLTACGVGVMLGAGISVLIGVVVGQARVWSPLAFLAAALAEATSVVLLLVCLGVNLAAIRIKRRAPEAPFRVPGWAPLTDCLVTRTALATSFGAGT